jgi:hypothetical protein
MESFMEAAKAQNWAVEPKEKIYILSHHYMSFNSFKDLFFHPCVVYRMRKFYIASLPGEIEKP